jgi:hypothetical protein
MLKLSTEIGQNIERRAHRRTKKNEARKGAKRSASNPKKEDKLAPGELVKRKLLVILGAKWENVLGLPEHMRILPAELQ